ncbi:MAG: zinc ABC transporter substrate-binding protein [Lentisphaeria bacterium]|nr:zinc ABC transporter substrate-binding protein [Lentisphaeria bacterium]MBR7104187.1 zinc ABC transporter substrate-binding protein [Lentisphaeria bacterium]
MIKSLNMLAGLLSGVFFFCGCGEQPVCNDGKLRVTAGLPPVAHIARAVAGDRIRINAMLPEGKSPHEYAPGPQDVRNASASALFLSTGLPFELRAVKPLAAVKVADVSEGTLKIPFGGDHEHGPGCIHDHNDHEGHHHEAMDPHVWLDPGNAGVIAKNIRDRFSALDPAGRELYERNCAAFLKELADADEKIKKELAPFAGREFFVYHAAFGYFAHRYKLKQTAIELGGREIAPARLAEVIRRARAARAKVVFVQPQFNPASSHALAKAIGGKAAPLDPLAGDVKKNLLEMARVIREGFGEGAAK